MSSQVITKPQKESQMASVTRTAIEQRSATQGWLSKLPSSWIPYLQLMRLDRYNGYWYFWLPHFYGTLIAAKELQSSPIEFLQINAILIWGNLIMRGATCTWNDTVDAPFDRQVSRCKNRPVARGAVSVWQAHTFTAVQTLLSMATLCLLPPLCVLYAIPAVIGWFCYPLAKRVTYYPQVVLGFPMAWGIFMGAASMGADPLNLQPLLDSLTRVGESNWVAALVEIKINSPAACAIYGANVIWTLLYELIYSHQDAPEDIAAGVKNLVLLYADTTGPEIRFTTMDLLVKLGIAQILLLAAAGPLGAGNAIYYTGTVAGAAAATAIVLSKVRLTVASDCAWWFKVGCCFSTGGAMASGLLGEYLFSLIM
jgi:4-hydroxybenzoate polyprenyltransferase